MMRKIVRFFRNLFSNTKKIEQKVISEIREKEITLPPWLMLAKMHMGVKEFAGKKKSNPDVERYFRISGFKYKDHISWCAAFVNYCLKKSDMKATNKLNARSYLKYGKVLEGPVIGCICVIWRESVRSWKGHVFFVIKFDEDYVYGLGGNQKDEVNIQRYPRSKVLGYRWPV